MSDDEDYSNLIVCPEVQRGATIEIYGEEHSQHPANTIIVANNCKEIMTLTPNDGIIIHRENFPDWTPDDFAQEVFTILDQMWRDTRGESS